MKGIPIRLEVGPKDIEKNQVVLVRRDTKRKRVYINGSIRRTHSSTT